MAEQKHHGCRKLDEIDRVGRPAAILGLMRGQLWLLIVLAKLDDDTQFIDEYKIDFLYLLFHT